MGKSFIIENNPAIGDSWDDIEKEIFSPEEIAESDARVAIIMARHKRGISQKKLAELSGVKHSVILRMESGETSPRLDTLLKLLSALDLTIEIVPIRNK